jgi:hypothetical protein
MPSKDSRTVGSIDKYVTDKGGVTGIEYIVNGKDDSDEEETGHSKGADTEEEISEEDTDSEEEDTSEEDESDEEEG